MMELTEAERISLSLAESDRTFNIRLVYFRMKRCEDCNPHGKVEFRSCERHMYEMAAL